MVNTIEGEVMSKCRLVMNERQKLFLLDRGIKPIVGDDYFLWNRELKEALDDYEIGRTFGKDGLSTMSFRKPNV